MKFFVKNTLILSILFWLWIAAIVIFSVIPKSPRMVFEVNHTFLRLDYLIHFMVYFIMTLLFILSKIDPVLMIQNKTLIYFLLGGFLLAGLSEIIQNYVPGRTFNPLDFYFNLTGIFAGIFSFMIYRLIKSY